MGLDLRIKEPLRLSAWLPRVRAGVIREQTLILRNGEPQTRLLRPQPRELLADAINLSQQITQAIGIDLQHPFIAFRSCCPRVTLSWGQILALVCVSAKFLGKLTGCLLLRFQFIRDRIGGAQQRHEAIAQRTLCDASTHTTGDSILSIHHPDRHLLKLRHSVGPDDPPTHQLSALTNGNPTIEPDPWQVAQLRHPRLPKRILRNFIGHYFCRWRTPGSQRQHVPSPHTLAHLLRACRI